MTVFITMAAISPCLAFDGKRSGFILGGGIGFGLASYTQTIEGFGMSLTSDRENSGAIATDVRIGFASNEQLEIYFASKEIWFGLTNAYNEKVTIDNAVVALGVSYYLNPTVPAFFVTGGLGLSSWSLPFESPSPDPWVGFGLYGGAGYEFSKHYSFELDLMYGNPSKSEGGITASSNALSVKVTVNALAY